METKLIGTPHALSARHFAQCLHTKIATLLHNGETLPHKGAIDPLKRHHIANRAERHQIKQMRQIRFVAACKKALLPQSSIEPDQHHESHADSRQMAEPAFIIGAARIDKRKTIGQTAARLVMVSNNHLLAARFGIGQHIMRHCSAINRNQQLVAIIMQLLKRRIIGAITLFCAVGDIELHIPPTGAPIANKQRGRGRAINIIITEHGNRLVFNNGFS